MAEPTSPPSLPSTADTVPYAPVSWMAVAAAGTAVVFIVLLLTLGYDAFAKKRPLILPELLVLPAVAVVLSFAARRVVRNSEQTRTAELFGVNLVNTSWWASLVLGLVYAAYLLGIDFSIRRDAEAEVQKWIGYVTAADTNRAFHRTLEPGRRAAIAPDNATRLEAEFRDPMLAFRASDLVRLAERNKGECTFLPGTLKDWSYRSSGVECSYTGTLKTPEGSCALLIPLKGVEAAAGSEATGRQWQVVIPPTGFVQKESVTRTPYGWLVGELERQGGAFAREFIAAAGNPVSHPYIYHGFIAPGGDYRAWGRVASLATARMAVWGGPGLVFADTAEYRAYLAGELLRLPAGGTPGSDKVGQFLSSWQTAGIVPAGSRIRGNPESSDQVRVTDSGVEVRVPAEIPLPGGGRGELVAARCRVVAVCKDPELLAELRRLKAEANPDAGTADPPPALRDRRFAWRITRVESDMYAVQVRQAPGGAGGPEGP